MSIFVVTGDGTLAKEIVGLLRRDSHHVIVLSRRNGIDISNYEGAYYALLRSTRPMTQVRHGPVAAIFNTAAWTAVDAAEDHPRDAFIANAAGAENVATIARKLSTSLVHFSTDAVFGDDQMVEGGPDELVEPRSPSSQYGRSKLLGEKLVLHQKPDAHIVRIGNLYGDAGRNWASKLRDALLRGEAVGADERRTVAPTWARWVAEASIRLVRAPGGTYHVAPTGWCSWADFADRMAADLAVDRRLVQRVLLSRRAPLTQRGLLSSVMLPLRGVDVPSWGDLLSRYLKEERTCTAS